MSPKKGVLLSIGVGVIWGSLLTAVVLQRASHRGLNGIATHPQQNDKLSTAYRPTNRSSMPDEQYETPDIQETMVQSSDEAQSEFAVALNDQDENTRQGALETAPHKGITLDRGLLERIVRTDPSESVRTTAFQALAALYEMEGKDIRPLIDLGKKETDTPIAGLASALEKTLDGPALSP